MSSDILARIVAVQAELAKIAAELSGPSTPQNSVVSSALGAPVKARRPKKITTEILEEVKVAGVEASKAISDAASENSEKTKKKRVISDERLAYLKSAEHIAKLKAGKEARKARKNAEKHAEELVNTLESVSNSVEEGEISE